MTADDQVLARELAEQAGDHLLELRRRHDGDAAALREAGDAGSHHLLMTELARARPADAVLSEHGGRHEQDASRVWIVDPLDGTREFGEPPRTDWAVHVALWERGDLVAGAVALPARGVVMDSATCDPAPAPPVGGPPRIAVSRTRPPTVAARVAELLGAATHPMGSAGVKILAVVLGDADVYLHGGGQYEWDSAAPVAVARAAGLHTSRLDGTPLLYNQPDPWLPDLLVCRPELVAAVRAALDDSVGTASPSTGRRS